MHATLPPTETRVVTSADGTRIYAVATGDPALPALVCIHGFALSSNVWGSIAVDQRWLDNVYLVRYDTRGHGRSDAPADDAAWASARIAEDFDAVVHEFKLHRPFILGWSLGGSHLADILDAHPPSYVAGLIYAAALPYIAPAVLGSVPTADAIGSLPALTSAPPDVATAATFVDLTFRGVAARDSAETTAADGLDAEGLAALKAACVQDVFRQPAHARAHAVARVQTANGLRRAAAAEVPVLVVYAPDDSLMRGAPEAEELRALGWGKTLTEHALTRGGHLPWVDKGAGAFHLCVLEWIKRVRKL